ncbi:hypothetical protein [Paraburkholderia sp. J76]|uniref:hypothetical protein n=1 Tax=Paraburkholderia sp. J76 TaxID=2805439 RepID=UPI002ABE0416|nr:hypothetical protein [Paraburkholderia sp. J76]
MTRRKQAAEAMVEEVLNDFITEQESEGVDDEEWRYQSTTPGRPDMAISWEFSLPDGSVFTDARWMQLAVEMQIAVQALFSIRPNRRKLKNSAAYDLSARVRFLVRWMVLSGHSSMGELTNEALDEYKAHVYLLKAGVGGTKGYTANTVSKYLSFPVLLYAVRDAIRNAGLPIIPMVPYGGVSPFSLAKASSAPLPERIPAVPDALYIPTMNAVAEWMDIQIPEALAALEEYFAIQAKFPEDTARQKAEMAKLTFSTPPSMSEPWCPGFAQPWVRTRRRRTKEKYRETGLDMWYATRALFSDVRDCCTIAIQGGTGMRISELCGLAALPYDKKTGWPACLEIERSPSGEEELFFIKGYIYKGEERDRPGRWLAGMRPVGSDYLPLPIRAALVLDKLYSRYRKLTGRNDLLFSLNNNRRLPDLAEHIGDVASVVIADGQNMWVHHYVDFPDEFEKWKITSHQWRKSFARFCFRVDETLLPAISRQLHHISVAMTEKYYLGTDTELEWLLRSESIEYASELLYRLTHGESSAGGMGNDAEDLTWSFDTNLEAEDQDEALDAIRRITSADNVWGWGLNWGACVFRPEHAQCNLRDSTAKILATSPKFDGLSPTSSCQYCRNLLILKEHKPFWQARKIKMIAVRDSNRAAGLSDVEAVTERNIAQCDKILERFE